MRILQPMMLACVAVALAMPIQARTCSLPPALEADWGGPASRRLGRRMRVLPDSDRFGATRCTIRLAFDTENRALSMSWAFGLANTRSGHTSELHELSFAPTAVCAELGVGKRLFVVGYREGTCEVVVERWTIQDLSMAARGDEGDDITTRLDMEWHKQLLFTAVMPPVAAAAFLPSTGQLLLLQEEAPHSIHALDTRAGSTGLAPLFDASTPGFAALEHARWMATLRVHDSHPDGGAFMLITEPVRAWEGLDEVPDGQEDAFLLLRDRDCDGIFDSTLTGTYEELMHETGFLDHEDVEYVGCQESGRGDR